MPLNSTDEKSSPGSTTRCYTQAPFRQLSDRFSEAKPTIFVVEMDYAHLNMNYIICFFSITYNLPFA
jgi:hypothetical protein